METVKSQNLGLTKLERGALQVGSVLIILYIVSFSHYLLFHSLAEILGASITFGIFLLGWNSRKFINNNYFVFVSSAFLTVGIFRVLHVLAYTGMHMFSEGDNTNISTQLWIAGQYILSISFLLAPAMNHKRINPLHILIPYLTIFALIIISIFEIRIFPTAYIEGQGYTLFRLYSGYAITIIFIASIFIFNNQKDRFDRRVFNLLVVSTFLLAIVEILFSLQVQSGINTGFSTILAHLLNIIAIYLAYLGIVEVGLMNPYRLLFKELKDREKELQYEKDKITSILDNMEDGVYITNKDGEIIYINPAMQKDFGQIKPHEKCYQYLHNQKEPCANCPRTKIISDLHTLRWEKYYPKSGRTYDIIESPMITPDGSTHKLEIFRDISQKKEIERAKDEFISLAAHQLRTPLANISLSSELLLRGVSGTMPEEQREYLNEIYRSTKRMSILISNFLNVSRIEMGNFHINPESLNISQILDQTVTEFLPLIGNKNLTLAKNIEKNIPSTLFDTHVFRIIVENLISNAIRYTPSGGSIEVSLKNTVGRILISVTDDGCGIPDDQQDMIFSKSFRTTNAKALTSEGAGLGLYMAKRAAEKTGCDLWFSSQLGIGTTFYVSIPIKN